MLIYFTDAVSENRVAINPKYVSAVFTATEGEMVGKTVIGLTTGTLIVSESQNEVFGDINGALSGGCC